MTLSLTVSLLGLWVTAGALGLAWVFLIRRARQIPSRLDRIDLLFALVGGPLFVVLIGVLEITGRKE